VHDAACSALLDQLPDNQRQQWLVLPPAVYDELAATSDLLNPVRASPGSNRSRTSAEGNDRLLVDAAIKKCVGGQVRLQSCYGPMPWTHNCQCLIVVNLLHCTLWLPELQILAGAHFEWLCLGKPLHSFVV
jgi:hypothetical protein